MLRCSNWVRFRTEKPVCFPRHTAIFAHVITRSWGGPRTSFLGHSSDIFRIT
jgi:hypothetical protein